MAAPDPVNLLKALRKKHWAWVVAIILIYVLWKAYVLYTPSPHDDQIPDKVKDAVLLLVYEAEYDTEPEYNLLPDPIIWHS
jgi:hypothetical protein